MKRPVGKLRHVREVLKRHPRWMLLGFATGLAAGALAAFAAAAFGGGHDPHGWYYVGAGVFHTGGTPAFFYYLAARQDRPQ